MLVAMHWRFGLGFSNRSKARCLCTLPTVGRCTDRDVLEVEALVTELHELLQ